MRTLEILEMYLGDLLWSALLLGVILLVAILEDCLKTKTETKYPYERK